MNASLKLQHFFRSSLGISLLFTAAVLVNIMMIVPPKVIRGENLAAPQSITRSARAAKNIVIVHGAFVDGLGFKEVYNNLTKKGFKVTVVQNPLTSLQDDVDAALRVLDKQDGPIILVAHSWGDVVFISKATAVADLITKAAELQ